MPRTHDKPPQGMASSVRERSPERLFGRIHRIFIDLGALHRDIVLEYEGVRYRVSCDDHAFMVYRVNNASGPRHHMPGWPVCLVNADVIFEECASPGLAEDHCACSLDIETWLQMLRNHCRPSL